MKGSVRKRGEKWSYYFTYKQDGKYKKKEKGGFATKREAEAALREALHLYDKNNIVKQFNSYTLYDYINYWLENEAKRTLKPRTLELYQYSNERYIKDEIGYIKITDFNPVILYKFLSQKQESYSSSSINNIRNVLNNAFNCAIREGIIHANPMSTVRLNPKGYNTERSQDKKALTKDEVRILLETAKGTKYYLPIIIALQMGLRRSEVLGLTWDNIDFENKTLTVNKILVDIKNTELKLTSPKTNSSIRTIKLTADVIKALKIAKKEQERFKSEFGDYYYKDHDFVYCQKDGSPISPNKSFTPLFRYFIRKNISFPVRFHDLRHTHATLMLEAGINPKVIQERLGHVNITTTLNVYSHATKDMEDDSVKVFENIFK